MKKVLVIFCSIALLFVVGFYFFGSSRIGKMVGRAGDGGVALPADKDKVAESNSARSVANASGDSLVKGDVLADADGANKVSGAEAPIGESSLLSGDALSLSKAKKLLDRDNFPALLRGFAGKYAGDPEAQELKKIYLSAMKEKLAARNDVSGIDFECGTSVCVGKVNMSGNKDDEGLVSGIFGPPTPAYGLLETSEVVGGVVEKRFVFSTDPKVNAISSN
ncbi:MULTISPECIES: hypothetical protein [Xanthomonas]|uniref:hypothetical protein n=1 Tax=Xanthomonas TaxID=338 RepID=UPI0011E69512|nr:MULTISPECIES: hypothetical protein [Xanthomonas]MCW0369411.1 hypothetical protein [Xanthomonas sacchari]MCW0452032.1 hypothetical protein [Xanthomonas sacchari]MDQ7761069.1 hypothetical protein [Xanthomonas sontii]UZK06534.1 hypothetical protein CJ027_007130 [Xanthomonas sontii]